MLAYTYTKPGTFELLQKPRPVLLHPQDALVRVTLTSICTSDLHIKHGSVPRVEAGRWAAALTAASLPGCSLGRNVV